MISQQNSEFFEYDLPDNLIAHSPSANRSDSKLLVYDSSITDSTFKSLLDFLPKKTVFILNDSKVVPARILFNFNGKDVEIFYLKSLNASTFECLVRPGKMFKVGVNFKIGDFSFSVLEITDSGHRVVKCDSANFDIYNFLDQFGSVPLPPYIDASDPDYFKERYQTVFAKHEGSLAAPTASLHFDDQLITKIKDSYNLEFVTLHVSLGTFAPVKSSIEDHVMHEEYYHVTNNTVDRLNKFIENGFFLVSVGTTALRVLQSIYNTTEGKFNYQKYDSTEIFIKPPFNDFCVDALITNFHLPKSTLLLLVDAFIGSNNTERIYNHAIKNAYRFFSFGDASLLIRPKVKSR
jgi:S-adenosylmethionine:tRNA ribosyltransferase-isomerase